MSIKLIVGLGNPGPQYADTRHNAGAWFVEALARSQDLELKLEKKFHGLIGHVTLADQSCRLLVPTTFMNLSGQAVQAMAHFYHLEPAEILVVHDELDLKVGVARLKFAGGHGGHNGLRDIFEKLGSHDFYRIRLGIGRSTTQQETADFVLETPPKKERDPIQQAIQKSLDVLPLVMAGKIEEAMKTLHTE